MQYRSVVKEVRKAANGVRVIYAQNGGIEKALLADYCIAALPVTILKQIENDFSTQVRKAIADTRYSDSYKIAWESKRFWETEYNIYGGISWLFDGPINMVWYPSAYFHNDFGVLLSGYGMQSSPFRQPAETWASADRNSPRIRRRSRNWRQVMIVARAGDESSRSHRRRRATGTHPPARILGS